MTLLQRIKTIHNRVSVEDGQLLVSIGAIITFLLEFLLYKMR